MMATVTTRLSDIFSHDYYQELEPEVNPELTALWQSGMIRKSPLFDDVANNGQGTATLFGWLDLDPDEDPNASTTDPDELGKAGKVSQASMTCRTLYLNKGYGSADLTTELASSAPLQHVRNRFGTYWARRWQRYLAATARGICAASVTSDGSDMVIDGGNDISAGALIDAAFTLGDRADAVSAWAVHSQVMRRMARRNLIEYIKDSDGAIILRTYLGKPIFMDDSLTYDKANKKFVTVAFGDGAFAYGEGSPTTPSEVERSAKGGNGGGVETIWERKTFILHPYGYSWKGGNDVEKSPMPAEYEKANNWKRMYARKNIPLAFVISGAEDVPITSGTTTGTTTGTTGQ